ncbi:MAG: 3-phosphoshikimate 1-carboxyvinyltransferase, partial [Pyrinomonadaceae bacterium]|nr:3-phosphoshikimate 1-carboxyvinyltransferase [Pyrinomonadaceae bacterium]
DKSISHRAAMIAAMAIGKTRVENFATSADCDSTVQCLQQLGVIIERDGNSIIVHGVGKKGFSESKEILDCQNSGTTMRLLSGILAGQNFDSVLTGDDSLRKRPMRRIIEPLGELGAKIESDDGVAPLKIFGGNNLQARSSHSRVASAQVKSCVLFAALNASGTTIFSENPQTRDHTERMLEWFGVDVKRFKTEIGHEIRIDGDSILTARDVSVPSDVSSAAFFIVAAACLKDSDLTLRNIGINPTRREIINVLQGFGANIIIEDEREVCNELVGNVKVCGDAITSNASDSHILSGSQIAGLIDELPILAVFGTQLERGLEVRDASELRVKESDRITTIVEGLRKMNAKITEFPDGFRVEKSDLRGAKVESHGDHRIAMSLAIAALFATGETEIIGAEAVDVSLPDFFSMLANISER